MDRISNSNYSQRSQRICDAIQLKTPDRVPISIEDEGVFVRHGGFTWSEVLYDIRKACAAAKKLCLDLKADTHVRPFVMCPAQVYDILNFKQLKWPSAELDENRIDDPSAVFQFVEPGVGYDAMKPEEYEWFIEDPTDFMIRGFWPNVSGALTPLRELPALWLLNSYSRLYLLAQFGRPEISAALRKLAKAGKYCLRYGKAMKRFMVDMVKSGYPPRAIAVCSQPFDYFGDYMRGTIGRMLDMYRDRDKLKEAVDKITPMLLREVVTQAMGTINLLDKVAPRQNHLKNVFMYLHGGAGGLMSNEQYKEFYWPALKKMIAGLIDAGLTPYIFSEGIYDDRLEIIADIPRGKVVWHIESDIFKAKEILGDTCCLEGGPPGSIMEGGTADDVKAYARKLIDRCGKDGGFIMGVSHALLNAKLENIKALVDFTKDYGKY